jgi:hypothetical protein
MTKVRLGTNVPFHPNHTRTHRRTASDAARPAAGFPPEFEKHYV